MNETPAFCPPNVSISDIWVDHGLSHCFLDTVSSSVVCGFILLFGLAQLIMYRKYSTRIDARRIRPSFLYKFQIFLMLLLPVLEGVRLELRWKYYDGAHVYGFMVSSITSCSGANFTMISLLDSLHIADDLLVSFRNMPNCKRASLSVAFSANAWSRHRLALVLHVDFHRSEHCPRKHQQQELVVPDGVAQRSN